MVEMNSRMTLLLDVYAQYNSMSIAARSPVMRYLYACRAALVMKKLFQEHRRSCHADV